MDLLKLIAPLKSGHCFYKQMLLIRTNNETITLPRNCYAKSSFSEICIKNNGILPNLQDTTNQNFETSHCKSFAMKLFNFVYSVLVICSS